MYRYRRCPGAIVLTLMLCCVAALAACSRSNPTRVTPTPSPAAAVAAQDLPEVNASAAISPAEGGQVALKDGASVSIPPDALSDTAVLSIQAKDSPPVVPIPRSLIGRAYDIRLEGGEMTGVARIRLPLPSAITSSDYDFAAFRWNGQGWERILGRVTQSDFELGTNQPSGIFEIQGQWRLADADLGLHMTLNQAGSPTIPISVTGEYRYSALPTLQDQYVPAHLRLKLDASGGTGQITGDESIDKTIGEATLLFQPDPSQAQGVIPFEFTFEVSPGDMDVQPGASRFLYAVLTVDDSPAPTRRLSEAVQYTQMLPIRVVGTEVVRPTLQQEPPDNLRWHVRFNGQTMAQPAATGTSLDLSQFLALGGLGDYRISLETDLGGRVSTVSNEVQVLLALPGTATPTPTPTAPEGAGQPFTPGPVIGTPTPGGIMPATPTRRTPPGAGTPTATATPLATNTPMPTPSPTRPSWASVFWADRYAITPGACATLNWNVQNIIAIYLDGQAVTGAESRQVCPTATTTYTLSVTSSSAKQDYRLTITVAEVDAPTVIFSAASYQIVTGQCTQLHWETSDVNAVYLNDAGVPGVATQQVCPDTTTTYVLRVERTGSASTLKSLTIKVLAAEEIPVRFWAEQYALATDACTNLHWSVQNVSAVYLTLTSGEQGVAGEGTAQVCPVGPSQFFSLRVVASDGRTVTKHVTLSVFNPDAPGLNSNEVIAQGIVNAVNYVADIDTTIAGDQPGYQITIDGIYSLFKGTGDCCQTALTLKVTVVQTADSMAEVVDWPVNPGQYVEFRGSCTGDTCSLPNNRPFYFKLRSD